MKKIDISKLFDNKTFTLIFSVVLAIAFWFIIVFSVSDESTTVIRDVPVTYGEGTAYKTAGLEIIDKTVYKVKVTVRGSRKVIGSLTKEDIIVTPDFSSATVAGVYELPLTATKRDSTVIYTITEINQPTLTLKFDKSESLKLAVETDIQNLNVRDGYIAGTAVVSPAEVTLSGAEAQLAQVKRAVVTYEVTDELSLTAKAVCNIELLDAGGNTVPTDSILMDYPTAELTIPVLKRGTLPVEIGFLNLPEGFDVGTLGYSLSVNSIEVAGPQASVDQLTPKTVGYVDLAQFALGENYVFDIQLPNGFINIDNITTVTASFQQDGLSSRRIRVTEIRLDNAPFDYKIELETTAINDVTVLGPQDELDTLLPSSVVAVADLSQISVQKGEYNIPVKFLIPASESLWVAGSYSIMISVTAR